MFPFKWKLSAKLLATVRKEPKYQGPFFSQYKHDHQPMFCASSFKANLAEGHSSTCQGAGPTEMFHLEPRLWGQRAVPRPYSLSSSRSIRCRVRKNKGGIAPLLPRQTLTQKILLHSLSASNLIITGVGIQGMRRAAHVP